jgi:hypothetical protein
MSTTQQPPAQPVDSEPTESKSRNRPPTWVIVAGVVLVIWAIVAMWPNSSNDTAGYSGTDTGGYTYTHHAANNGPATGTALYHQYVQNDIPELAGASDMSVDNLGRHVCTALENSGISAVAATFISQDWNAQHAATFVGYSVATFCPTEKSLLTP